MSSFTIENGILKKYNGQDRDIIVPQSVTKIGPEVFDDIDHPMTSVILPEGVTVDGDAFWGEEEITVFYDQDSAWWLAEYYLEMQDNGCFDDKRVNFDKICKASLRTDNGERTVYAYAFPLWRNASNQEGSDILPNVLKMQDGHLLTFPESVVWVDAMELAKAVCQCTSVKIVVKNPELLKKLLQTEQKLLEPLLAGCMDQLLIVPEMFDEQVLLQEPIWGLLLDYAHKHDLEEAEALLMKKHKSFQLT